MHHPAGCSTLPACVSAQTSVRYTQADTETAADLAAEKERCGRLERRLMVRTREAGKLRDQLQVNPCLTPHLQCLRWAGHSDCQHGGGSQAAQQAAGIHMFAVSLAMLGQNWVGICLHQKTMECLTLARSSIDKQTCHARQPLGSERSERSCGLGSR